jgi:hypothetical protein
MNTDCEPKIFTETKQMNEHDHVMETTQISVNYQQITHLLQCYAEWVGYYIDNGWQGYLLTFMLYQLPGLDASRLLTMKKHVAWFYGRLAKASVPKASSLKWSSFRPKLLVAPDLPVPKRSKQHTKDVTINNGIHWHGLALVNPLTPKLDVALDLHIKANLTKYCVGSIKEINARMITHRPRHVASYGMKGLKPACLTMMIS